MLKGEEPLSTLKRITSYAIIKTALSALTNMRIAGMDMPSSKTNSVKSV